MCRFARGCSSFYLLAVLLEALIGFILESLAGISRYRDCRVLCNVMWESRCQSLSCLRICFEILTLVSAGKSIICLPDTFLQTWSHLFQHQPWQEAYQCRPVFAQHQKLQLDFSRNPPMAEGFVCCKALLSQISNILTGLLICRRGHTGG